MFISLLNSGTSWKAFVRKGKELPRSGGKSIRNSPTSIKVREEEELFQAPEQTFTCSLWRNHTGEGIFLQPVEEPKLQ